MKTKLVLVFSALATAVSLADVGDNITTLTTLSGKTYRGVLISQVSPDGVLFRHANGAGKVLFSDLPGEIRQALGYDAKKAEAYEKDLTDRRERERLACIDRDKEIAKAQASAFTAAAAESNMIQAQYIAAASQQGGYGYGESYPVAYGYGWYNQGPGRFASPTNGGRGYGNSDRQPDQPQGVYCGTAYRTIKGNPNANRNEGQPFSAGQIKTGVPYSGTNPGTARFTNGVPALGTSFAPSRAPSRAPGGMGAGGRPTPTGAPSPAGRGR